MADIWKLFVAMVLNLQAQQAYMDFWKINYDVCISSDISINILIPARAIHLYN
jgi:hypothetical protein